MKLVYTIETLRSVAHDRGGECLSTQYTNGLAKYRWKCQCGYEWAAKFVEIKRGGWCPRCARKNIIDKKRNSLKKLQHLAASRGGQFLDPRPPSNNKMKCRWRCSCGCEWSATPNRVQQGTWCPRCSSDKNKEQLKSKNANVRIIKKDINYLHELATQNGGECLSTTYQNNKTKYEWRCRCGCIWSATAAYIKKGHWCPKCSLESRAAKMRLTLEDLQQLAQQNGGECLSTESKGALARHKWKCGDCGHTWETTPSNIRIGHWCPECAKKSSAQKRSKTIEDVKEIARAKGGECLSDTYINGRGLCSFKCQYGHTWKSSGNRVRKGQWCPHCSHRHSKAELQLFEFVKQLYPDAINGARNVLPNTQFELDIYVPSLQKAIEFDGRFWHSTDEAQSRDLRKNQECANNNIELLRITEDEFLADEQSVYQKIQNFLTSPLTFSLDAL